jgi:ribosome assembly protein 1
MTNIAQRCLKDLRERFAKVEIQASNPIVPFRETAIKAVDMAPPKTPNAPRGTMHGTTSHSLANFTVRAIPMPESMTTFLQVNQSIISRLEREAQHEGHDHQHQPHSVHENGAVEGEGADGLLGDEEAAIANGEIFQRPTVRLEEFWSAFHDVAKAAGGEWGRRVGHVWAFGPNRVGPNVLLDYRPEGERW